MPANSDRLVWGGLALTLFALVVVVFGQTLAFDFVALDDGGYVYENARVAAGLSAQNLLWAFTSGVKSNWHPLTWLSYMLDAELFGIDPHGFHATNLLLHGLSTVFLFGALRSLTGATGRSALVAALFAVHPLHVESVAWISERKDVLSAAFGFLSMWTYSVYARRGGLARYGLMTLFFALGLLSKSMLVTLPCVFLLLDIWPLRRFDLAAPLRRWPSQALLLVAEKLPLLLLSALASLMTFKAQQQTGVVMTLHDLSLLERAANAVHAVGWYAVKTVWPTGLAAHYPHPYLLARGGEPLAPLAVAAAVLFVAGLSLLTWWARRRTHLLVGWFWFLGMLVPVIGLVQVSDQAHADRYTYLPLIGLFIAGVWEAGERVARARKPLWMGAGLAGALVAALAVSAHGQTRHWRDSVALFSHAHATVPEDVFVQVHLGIALQDAGRPAEAIPHYAAALKRDPGWPLVYFQRGLAHVELKQLALAEQHFRAALRLTPAVPEVHLNLAGVLLLAGNLEGALEHYGRALELRPADPRALVGLGGALARAGRLEAAASTYRRALELAPGDTETRVRLGHALGALGRLEQAEAELERALAEAPGHPAALRGLALLRREPPS
jgi:tetratricopeptide (TPR) repeat protein